MSVYFKSCDGLCTGTVTINGRTLTVNGNCKCDVNKSLPHKLFYKAAAPPESRTSISGSYLPWANEEMAYNNTPNKGIVDIVGGKFQFTLNTPNCFYINNGSKLVFPHLHLSINKKEIDIELPFGCTPNRSLTNLPGRPVRTSGR